MAETGGALGSLGTQVVGYLPSGRPIIANPDGSFSTERTITVEIDKKWFNIPTMFAGQEVSPEDAKRLIIENGLVDPDTGKKIKSFANEPSASAAAQKQSEAKGRVIESAIASHQKEQRAFPTAFNEDGSRKGAPATAPGGVLGSLSDEDQRLLRVLSIHDRGRN